VFGLNRPSLIRGNHKDELMRITGRITILALLALLGIVVWAFPAVPRAHALSTVELSSSSGPAVCPSMLSGFGTATWNSTTRTCALSSSPNVSPTLCIRGTVGGCVLNPIDILQIDQNVTFTTNGFVAIYSTVTNYGLINNNFQITIYGVLNNYGTINDTSVSGTFTLPYTGQGILNNYNGATVTNRGIIENDATINNSGLISNYCPGRILQQHQIIGNPVQDHLCAPDAPRIRTSSGTVFNTTTPTITGISELNITITLYNGGSSIGSTTSDLTGNWSITTVPLSEGSHNVTATATNSLGTSPLSFPVTIIIELKHTTGTSLTCASGSAQLGSSVDCVVTVTDTSSRPTTPTGSVTVTTSGSGTFSASSCVLNVGSCHLTYSPISAGFQSLRASFSGDQAHFGSDASFALSVFDLTVTLTPSSGTVLSGTSTNLTVTIGVLSGSIGFPSTIPLAVSGLPPGASVSGLPASLPVPGSVSFTITTGSSPGNFTLTVLAKIGGISQSGQTGLQILSPKQAIGRLVDQVNGLQASGLLSRAQTNALVNTLELALRGLDAGQPRLACVQMSGFARMVNLYVRNNRLTSDEASLLLNTPLGTYAVIASINC